MGATLVPAQVRDDRSRPRAQLPPRPRAAHRTAKGIAVHTGGTRFRVRDLYDPELNVRYGSWYLRHLLDKYGDERTALAAYNAGQENVDEWRRNGKGFAFAETRHYVKRVERLKTLYRRGYAKELSSASR